MIFYTVYPSLRGVRSQVRRRAMCYQQRAADEGGNGKRKIKTHLTKERVPVFVYANAHLFDSWCTRRDFQALPDKIKCVLNRGYERVFLPRWDFVWVDEPACNILRDFLQIVIPKSAFPVITW